MGVAFSLVGGALGVACPGFLFWKVGSYGANVLSDTDTFSCSAVNLLRSLVL